MQGGPPGTVRSWVHEGDEMLFNMRNNRWCGNIGRPHRNNGVFYTVDLRSGRERSRAVPCCAVLCRAVLCCPP